MGTESSHHVAFVEGSLSAEVFEVASLPVNSLHHQSLAEPAERVQVEGVSSDGVIESVSVPGCRFVLGVQWHPEELATHLHDGSSRDLFADFVEHCSGYASSKMMQHAPALAVA